KLDLGELLEIVSAFYSQLDGADTTIQQAIDIPDIDALDDVYADADHSQTHTFAATMNSTSGIRERFRGLEDDGLRAVLDNVADMVVTVDAEGVIQFANRMAVQFFAPERRSLTDCLLGDYLPGASPTMGGVQQFLTPFVAELDSTNPNLCGGELTGRHPNGESFRVELTASRLKRMDAGDFVICMRDVSVRAAAESALKENEERYRALVEHAPEAILVFDVDSNNFVDANENASELFNLSRRRLLASGFFGLRAANGEAKTNDHKRIEAFLQRALNGDQPVFEWLYRDRNGDELPCEVRLSRMPAVDRSLVRVSVHSIATRKQRELIDYSEKKLLEMIASGVPLKKVLRAICRTAERVISNARAAVMISDTAGVALELVCAPAFNEATRRGLKSVPLDMPRLSSGVAVATRKPVIMANVLAHHAWQDFESVAVKSNIAAAWSFPLFLSDGQATGTVDIYLSDQREPTTDEFDWLSGVARLAGIAVARERSREALSQSEGRFRSLFENVVEGVYISTRSGTLIAANPAMVDMLGYDDETELLVKARRDSVYHSQTDAQRFSSAIDDAGEIRNFEAVMIRKDGKRVDVVENARAVTYTDGETYVEGTISDITARKQAEARIFSEKERAEITLKSIGDGVITTDAAGCVEYMNPVAEALTGWSLRAASGQAVEDVLTMIHEHSRELIDNPIIRCLNEGRVIAVSDARLLIDRSGAEIAIQDTAAPIRDSAGHITGAVMVFHDASQEGRLSRKLSYQASHDALTGFINRQEFESALARALTRAQASVVEDYALLYIDLDQFKVVNDTFGHTAGDELIRQLARRLQTTLLPNDIVARLGGDEFGVLLSNGDADRAQRVAEEIRASIEAFRFEWQNAVHTVHASIGIVLLDRETSSVNGLLSAADVACFAAKDMGRNQVHLYREGEAGKRHQQMHWLSRINRALEEGRFELYYQPIAHTDGDGAIDYCRHYEVLLRMIDEDGERVLPTTFIAAAERYDRMPALDRWVVTEALKHADQGDPAEPAAFTLSINLSGNSLSDDRFLEFLKDSLQGTSLCAGAVCFEITETAAIANLTRVRHFMSELSKLGCLFSLDDFGSGLCSFGYLKNLPVDFVKIDGAFIRDVATDVVDQSMVAAIQQVAQAMGIETVAEHVETAETRCALARLGVSLVQGFEVASPAAISEFSPWEAGEASWQRLAAKH
ncbi:MAG: EAL domain-containing protein, partial [Pseudomonadota bacterium]